MNGTRKRAPDSGVGTKRCILAISLAKKNMRRSTSKTAVTVPRMVEDIVGCKWSLAVLGLVRRGVCRPGAMEHAIDGLSAKVLNERLKKLVRYGILAKRSYPEVPPRVEYELTAFGLRLAAILDSIEQLQSEAAASAPH